MFRFTIRDVLWLTALVGVSVGWWADHRQQSDQYESVLDELDRIHASDKGGDQDGK